MVEGAGREAERRREGEATKAKTSFGENVVLDLKIRLKPEEKLVWGKKKKARMSQKGKTALVQNYL